MSGHTPEPWVLEASDDGHLIRMGTALDGEPQRVLDYDHMLTPEDGDGSQFAEAEANARLIAAAPDLLASLIWAENRLDWFVQTSGGCDCEICYECGKEPQQCTGTECAKTCQCTECDHCQATGARADARAVIAKVKGRTP